MATFKTGQKVKRVRDPLGGASPAAETTMPIGMTGAVTGAAFGSMVCVQPDSGKPTWYCDPTSLEPLTDPGADAFMERIKKLKPYNEPLANVQRRFIDKIESVVGPLGPRFK